jgi:hypothetical protein
MASYTIKNVKESEDVAVKGGVSEMQEARFAWRDLDAEQTGLAHIVVHPRQAPAVRASPELSSARFAPCAEFGTSGTTADAPPTCLLRRRGG